MKWRAETSQRAVRLVPRHFIRGSANSGHSNRVLSSPRSLCLIEARGKGSIACAQRNRIRATLAAIRTSFAHRPHPRAPHRALSIRLSR